MPDDLPNLPSIGPVATFFGDENAPVFGVYHASTATPRMAVLLLSPFGAEDMSAHRGWRDFAQSLADTGLPCLRFDYPGTGDSCGMDAEADHLAAWLAAAHSGADWLRAVAGVESLAVVGLRLGSLLATELARTRADVESLLQIAPPRNGQAYVRELKMLASATAVPAGDAALAPDPTNGMHAGAIFAAGFVLNAATCDALRRLQPPAQLRTPWVAVVDREEMPLGPDWLKALVLPAGSRKAYAALSGYGPMMLTAHLAVPPLAVYAHARKVLQQVAKFVPPGSARPVAGCVQSAVEVSLRALALRESVVDSIGPYGMSGILTEPTSRRRRNGHAVLVLNSSAERRIGPNGMWVLFARERAARGDMVLRFDLPGLGESPDNPADTGHPVYPARAIECIRAALDFLRHKSNGASVTVVGLCSGAFHALNSVVDGLEIKRAVIINPFILRKNGDEPVDLSAQGGQAKAITENAVRNLRDPQRWLKLLRGQVNVGTILGSMVHRTGVRVLVAAKRAGRALNLIPHLPVTRDLQKAIKRKVHLHFVFA
ncbi:MAG: hypothetical protein RLZZ401_2431, partial [Pseudomonadota bacterium]